MKKLLAAILALVLIFSVSANVFAAGRSEDKAKGKIEKEASEEFKGKSDQLKKFKEELNAQKKLILQEKAALNQQKASMQEEYDALIAAGDLAGAEALFVGIEALNVQIQTLHSEMKRIINERFMVVKSEYSEEELATFENAAALIAKMYEDVEVLGLGSVTINKNIIKFDAPPYIKGGRTIIPVRAITENMGASVVYNPELKSVTISKDNTEIVFAINSTIVLVDGVEQVLDSAATINNGRTYVPLRFIAETFGLTVEWDAENEIIDIEEPEAVEEPEAPEAVEEPEAPEAAEEPEAPEVPEEE